jgi:amidophosphoribosyltransferase
MKTACGIFGIVSRINEDVIINKTINGLDLLQHRGRESGGIAYFNPELTIYKKNGLVKQIFKNYTNNSLVNKCIGHVRYSTSGKIMDKTDETDEHIQPYKAETNGEEFAMVYNGNIKNINRAVQKFGVSSDISIDTKMIIEIIKKIDRPTLREKLIEFMKNVNGVYCLLIMTTNGIYCLRDSYGVRPLCIGQNETGYCISSESCALQDYKFLRTIEPGELIFVNDSVEHIFHLKRENTAKCIFEHIYFMNKDSRNDSKTIEGTRYQVGFKLAMGDITFNKETTLVTGCPQTGIPYGKGYADYSGLEYAQFLKKKDNAGRTFILPENDARIVSCKKNLYISGDIAGRDLVLLDDSLVRGNTLTTVIKKLRENGAKSVHIRITSPPVRFPCYFGVDIPSQEELIASKYTVEQIREKIGADTLVYTDLDIIKEAINDNNNSFCSACFDGQYKKELLDW